MDTESILSKLDEITVLLELSCRQQQEILSRLDGQNAPASAEPMEIPPEDIPEIPSIEFPFRPEDPATMLAATAASPFSFCPRQSPQGTNVVASQQKLTIRKQYEFQKLSCTPLFAIV